MLNSKTGKRELCYLVLIDSVKPIEGYDRVELATIGGWTVVVGKNEFKAGDPAVYFEIDSKLPEVEPFSNISFLAKKHYQIKSQKMCGCLSQGLLISINSFKDWWVDYQGSVVDNNGVIHNLNDESRFLTEQLNVTYVVPEDNKRKSDSVDKYKLMAKRKGKLFSYQPFKFLMKTSWGKRLLFLIFGKSKDKKKEWPEWVKKTDEERIENVLFLLKDKTPWIATEKIDGSSVTFTLKRKTLFHKEQFLVCSRNVVYNNENQTGYYDINIYHEMAKKYSIFEKMTYLLNHYFQDCDWITIQGECYGEKVQRRDYHMQGRNFMAFNFITSKEGRWNSVRMKDLLERKFGIPCVPILDDNYILPDTVDELRTFVDSDTSVIDGGMREGIVFRSPDGLRSFKCVSPTYLMTYHS